MMMMMLSRRDSVTTVALRARPRSLLLMLTLLLGNNTDNGMSIWCYFFQTSNIKIIFAKRHFYTRLFGSTTHIVHCDRTRGPSSG